MIENQITSSFIRAATELGFSFEPGFLVTLKDSSDIQSLGLVRHFGSKVGTLVFSESESPEAASVAELESLGYFVSVLFKSYHVFNEEHFKATLNDWGFYGREQEPPQWFTGAQWGH